MNYSRPLLGLLCVCAGIAGLAGCGGDGVQRYAVSGEVKWRNKPLDHGVISFEPVDASVGTGGAAQIKDGRYTIPAEKGLAPGRYKVLISSADPGKAPDPDAQPGPSGPLPKDRINPKYNLKSDLIREVKAEGPNTFNFSVD